jgi:hypothetical protein
LETEKWLLKLLNLERFQTFSTQITLEAPFFLYSQFFWNSNLSKTLANIFKYLETEEWLLELLNLERF